MDTNTPKYILQSKTFWANLLAPGFLWLATRYGIKLDPDTQTIVIFMVMSLINIGLRLVTKQPVTLSLAALHPQSLPSTANELNK